jgi:hypothetical protein
MLSAAALLPGRCFERVAAAGETMARRAESTSVRCHKRQGHIEATSMPVRKFTCPDCEAVLRPAKPLPSGKRVTCPKCGAGFVVRGEEDEAEPEGKSPKKSPATAIKPKDDPFGDDGPAMYAVIKEEEPVQEQDEEEDEDYEDEDEDRPRKKPKKKDGARMEDLEFRTNTEVTDPRGPAQAALISPSNFLMLCSFITIVVAILALAYGAWPFLFMDYLGLEPKEVLNQGKKKDDEDKGGRANINLPQDQDPTKLQGEPARIYWEAYDAKMLQLIIIIITSVIVIIYNSIIIIGGVKMQNMESYTWAMVATIMAFVPLSFPGLSQLAALMSLTTLRTKKVIDGFTYVPASATPYARQRKREVL